MPAFITHYLYGVELYQRMNTREIKNIIRDHIGPYRLGLQGPDLFFYHPLCMFQPARRNIGSRMHEIRTSRFLVNCLLQAIQLSPPARETALSYLCGFIAHYTLDSSVHPYIYARTGYEPRTSLPGSFYFEKHAGLETRIDTLLLSQKRGWKPSQFHTSRTLHMSRAELNVISTLVAQALENTYSDLHCPGTHKSSIPIALLCMKSATSILYSRTGKRKKLFLTFEKAILHYGLLSALVALDDPSDDSDALNLNHTVWHNPWKPEQISTASVPELICKARQKYIHILPYLADFINGGPWQSDQKIKPLLKELGNVSYHSGL